MHGHTYRKQHLVTSVVAAIVDDQGPGAGGGAGR